MNQLIFSRNAEPHYFLAFNQKQERIRFQKKKTRMSGTVARNKGK